jgi:hypothetical protein
MMDESKTITRVVPLPLRVWQLHAGKSDLVDGRDKDMLLRLKESFRQIDFFENCVYESQNPMRNPIPARHIAPFDVSSWPFLVLPWTSFMTVEEVESQKAKVTLTDDPRFAHLQVTISKNVTTHPGCPNVVINEKDGSLNVTAFPKEKEVMALLRVVRKSPLEIAEEL